MVGAFGEEFSSGNTLFLILFRKCRSFNRDVKIENKTQVNIAATRDVDNVNVKTEDGIATLNGTMTVI
jgi:hypothetical protein